MKTETGQPGLLCDVAATNIPPVHLGCRNKAANLPPYHIIMPRRKGNDVSLNLHLQFSIGPLLSSALTAATIPARLAVGGENGLLERI